MIDYIITQFSFFKPKIELMMINIETKMLEMTNEIDFLNRIIDSLCVEIKAIQSQLLTIMTLMNNAVLEKI